MGMCCVWQQCPVTATCMYQAALHDAGCATMQVLLISWPKTAQEMASAAGFPSSSEALFRLLRMSTSSGVFTTDGPLKGSATRFKNNKMSILLRTDHPNSIRHLLMHIGTPPPPPPPPPTTHTHTHIHTECGIAQPLASLLKQDVQCAQEDPKPGPSGTYCWVWERPHSIPPLAPHH